MTTWHAAGILLFTGIVAMAGISIGGLLDRPWIGECSFIGQLASDVIVIVAVFVCDNDDNSKL